MVKKLGLYIIRSIPFIEITIAAMEVLRLPLEIQKKLLNTNLCRNNKKYFDWINELDCSTSDVCRVIIDGCIANASGSFEWDWCDNE